MIARRRTRSYARQSSAFRDKRRNRLAIGAAAGIVAVFSWAFVISRTASLPAFTISSIEVHGADPGIVPAVQAAVLGAMDGSYLGLFPKDSILFYPAKDITGAVASSSPEIRTVSLSRGSGNSLSVSVTEKEPAAVICPELPNADGGAITPADTCYYADSSGLIYSPDTAPTSDQDTGAKDVVYVPALAQETPYQNGYIGLMATSTDHFRQWLAFMDGARSAGLSVFAMLSKGAGQYEMYVSEPGELPGQTATSSGYVVVYADDASGLDTELSNLKAFWADAVTAPAKGVPPRYDYIDLRYGANVFYRLQQSQ